MENSNQSSVNNKNNRVGKTNNPKGRPKGTKNKPRILDYISLKEIDDLLCTAKELASKGDTKMLAFILNHIFGRADVSVDVTSDHKPIPLLPISLMVNRKVKLE